MRQSSWKILLQQEKCPLGSLVEIGEIQASRGGMVRFRRLQRYAFVLILEGDGHYDDELGRSRSLTAGDWILVLPDFGHCYTPWKRGGWDELYIMFEGPVFEAWRSSGLLSPSHLTGHLPDPEAWLVEFRTRVLDPGCGSLEKLCAFQRLLGQAIQGSAGPMETTDRPGWFAEACRLLSQPHEEPRDVATRLGLTYESFRRRFRQLAGLPPRKFHLSQMINSAARLLDSTDLKSAEIARSLGFCDEAYFSRAFKKEKGRSPRSYRRNQFVG